MVPALLFPRKLGALLTWGFAAGRCCYLAGNLVHRFDARAVGHNSSKVVHHGVHHFDLMRLVRSKVNALRCGQQTQLQPQCVRARCCVPIFT